MTHVAVIDEIHEDGLALIKARPDIELDYLSAPTSRTIAEVMAHTNGLILRGRTLDPLVWDNAPHLKIVSRHGVGCDNLPLERLAEKGINVAITAGANAISVAEQTMALMLAAVRDLIAADHAVRAGDFARREKLIPFELYGRTLLIVGLGRIGREVAVRARAFGMRILGYDPALPKEAIPLDIERRDDLDAALAEAQVLTLHLPRTCSTRGLFGAEQLSRLPKGAVLVNTARGGIVDEDALRELLADGHLTHAGLDVFAQEPLPVEAPILSASNITVTPHDAAMTREGARRMALQSAQNLLDYFDGQLDPEMRVNISTTKQ